MPFPFEVATGDVRINAVVVTIDSNTKQAEHIERICIKQDYVDSTSYDSDDGKPEYFNNF